MPVLRANASLPQIPRAPGTQVSHERFISPWCLQPLRSFRQLGFPLPSLLGLWWRNRFYLGHVCIWSEGKGNVLTNTIPSIKSFDCQTEFISDLLILAKVNHVPIPKRSAHISQTDPISSKENGTVQEGIRTPSFVFHTVELVISGIFPEVGGKSVRWEKDSYQIFSTKEMPILLKGSKGTVFYDVSEWLQVQANEGTVTRPCEQLI